MLEIKEKIHKELVSVLNGMGIERESVVLEQSNSLSNGDLTTNIAMQISKEFGKSPMEVAQDIADRLNLGDDISNVEVANPGFINFFLSEKALLGNISNILGKGEGAFQANKEKGKNLVIEYTDPNPFKTLHIGHLYTNMVGESFARLQGALGANVSRAIYQGDVGLHVAKTIYGLDMLLKEKGILFNSLKTYPLEEKVRLLGDAYILGFKYYDDIKDEQTIEMVRKINLYIFSFFISSIPSQEYFKEFEDMGIKDWYFEGRQWCMEYFERIYARTGTKFDYYFLESEMGEKGLEMVLNNTQPNGKQIFKRDNGAVIYEGDPKKGLHTRVFINKEGLPTYEAKEIALPLAKKEKVSYDESVVITANEQTTYFEVVLDALSQLEPELAKATKHFSHGMIKLPGAEKMSSRKGKIIEGEWLLNETRDKVESLMQASGKYNEEDIKQISDKIAVGAIKYAFLKVSVGKDVSFDFDIATSFDGDTGPYLQYVYARCNSILKDQNIQSPVVAKGELNVSTKDLIRYLSKFNGVLLSSGIGYSPSTMCTYLFELGQLFNTFYQNVRVLDSEDKEFLLGVVKATADTMKYGLKVLGIETVEKM